MKLFDLFPVLNSDERLWIYDTSGGRLVMGGAYFDEMSKAQKEKYSTYEVYKIHSMIHHGILGIELRSY
jgi:hypothetical protein